MDFLHYEVHLGPADAVRVEIDRQANVRLLDSTNFSRYRRGERHSYFGGLAAKSPILIPAPHAGHWHVAIDLGGNQGVIRAAVSTIQG